MDAERWAVIESFYHAALERAPGERSAYIAAACAEDPTLRSELESLLAFAEAPLSNPCKRSEMAKLLGEIAGVRATDSLTPTRTIGDVTSVKVCPQCNGWFEGEIDHCPSDGAELVGAPAARTPPAMPATIGRYRILRLVGEGGMGAVYEAEQEQPRRTVALKVIKPSLASPELLRRFELESQALGRLQHPGIAQIFEAGTSDTGFGPQPYFAMEFIRGESLLQYANAHQLNAGQRLDLMAKVCEAVHHAHQRGIIHRDLKPVNILVDDSGQPKVLDFGVARVTDSDAQATRQTDVGRLVGTLAYMSPEQVLADPLEVDTRSDVYALGVILYELLAGRPPYTVRRNISEAVQTIREEDPAPLSSVSRNYRGDIETIVAKALEKDKARRYASAAGLAADIRLYLTDEPIVARPPSATYQLQKFAHRHKALVAGTVAVFVVLIAGIIASTWEATRARSAEQAAKAVNDFLQNDLLAQASANTQARPGTKPDQDLKVRTALDRAAAKIEGKFTAQPLVEASIRQTIGNTYTDLGLYQDAQRQLERAIDLRRHAMGELNRDTLSTMNELAEVYHYQGKFAQAEPLYSQVLAIRRRVLGQEHPETLDTMNDFAILFGQQGKYAQAEPLLTKILETRRRVQGEDHPDTLTSMNNLAGLYRDQGNYAQAAALFIKALEGRRHVLGDEHPNTLSTMNNLAALYLYQGKFAQAEPLCTDALVLERRVLGQEHSLTLTGMNNLAGLYRDQGKYLEANGLYSKTLELQRGVLGEEHPDTLLTMNNVAQLYFYEGKYEQATQLYNKILELQLRVLGADHPRRLASMNDLAFLYMKRGNYATAESLLHEALSSFDKTAPENWRRYSCQSMLGGILAGQKRYVEAEPLLLSGYEGMLDRESTIPAVSRFKLKEAGEQIVGLYRDWEKPEKATEWRKRLHLISSASRTK